MVKVVRIPFDEPAMVYCVSGDDKPLDVPNGSMCMEMDTSKVYLYDEESQTWHEWGGA